MLARLCQPRAVMIRHQTQMVVLGAGFAGSLMALICRRLGYDVLLIDHGRHPRFAIGESSTPIGNSILQSLARRYDLPQLLPLAKFGSWCNELPELMCGLKRGFSYFAHHEQQPFVAHDTHATELLVTASADDEHGDTHWLRADVDQYFFQTAVEADIPTFTEATVERFEPGLRWVLNGTCQDESLQIEAEFVIDATGAGALLSRHLSIANEPNRLRTNSRAIYSHFLDVRPWTSELHLLGGRTADHPFNCDQAALHHILNAAWMWNLRFRNDLVSAGLAVDANAWPLPTNLSPEQEWHQWLARYPSLGTQFAEARLASMPGQFLRTGRMQRLLSRAVGERWALLPHTVGFIDPLHSSGIAHTLCGIEMLARILEQSRAGSERSESLQQYETRLFTEFSLIDQLVHGCYQAHNFSVLAAYSMAYFAAATTYEHRRAERGDAMESAFLCADDVTLRRCVDTIYDALTRLTSDASVEAFERFVAHSLAPFNQVGLCDPAVHHMYRYTAAPE